MARKKAPGNTDSAREPLNIDAIPTWALASAFATATDPRYRELVESGRERVMDAARTYTEKDDPNIAIEHAMAEASWDGDATFTQVAAAQMLLYIYLERELNPLQWLLLTELLQRVVAHEKTAAYLTSKTGRPPSGAPTKGTKAFGFAWAVVAAIQSDGATSIEDAWRCVGEKYHLSARTVQKHWKTWKPVFANAKWTGEDGQLDPFDLALRRQMDLNKAAKLGK